MKVSQLPVFINVLILLFFLTSCKHDGHRAKSPVDEKSDVIESDIQLSNVNFYLENSGSMNPYTKGTTNFNQSIVQLLRNIELLPLDTIQIFAANTEIHNLNQNINSFQSSFINNGIPGIGNIHDSDLNLIFENILQNHEDESISILVTDAIYSVEGTKEELIQNLQTEAYKTRNAFIRTLKDKNIGTLCLKLTSTYDGFYYPAVGGRIEIDQERPYYIWVFANNQLIKEFVEETDLFNLPGQKEYFYSFDHKDIPVNYSILEHSIGDIGSFRNDRRGGYPVHTISNAERSDRGDTEGQFGFAVAVDFTRVPLPESHLMDTANYRLSSDDYTLYDIITIESINDQKLKEYIGDVEDKMDNSEFTHILLLKSENKFLESITVELHNENPEWIAQTGTDDDTNIEGNTTETFGFEKLTTGILDAYDQVNESSRVLSLQLHVK